MKLTYNKTEKLKSKKEIEALFLKGKSVSAWPLRLVYLKNEKTNKVGVSVSKRNFKLAVDRIKIKRLLREAYRLNKTFLKDNNIEGFSFMILYNNKEMPDFNLINSKVKTLFTKFNDQNSKVKE